MKRKTLLTLFGTTCAVSLMAACALIFVGCGEDKSAMYEVETDFSSTVGNLSSLDNEGAWATPVKASEAKFDVYLSDWYDADTVVVKANGKAVPFTKDASFTERDTITGGKDKIGTLDYTSIKENTTFTVEAQPKQLNFTFALADMHGETPITQEHVTSQQNYLSDFRVGTSSGTSLYTALTQDNYKYTIDCVSIFQTNGGTLKIACNKKWSYYNASGLVMSGNSSMSPDYSSSDVYRYTLWVDALNLKRENVLAVDPLAVSVGKCEVRSLSGDIVKISSSVFEEGTSFSANKTGAVTISLDGTSGANLSGAELYINDKKVSMTDNNSYTLTVNPVNGTPLDYLKEDTEPNAIVNTNYYYITVKNVDFSAVSGMVKLTGASFVSCYYTDGQVSYLQADSTPMGVQYTLKYMTDNLKDYTVTMTLTPVSGSPVTVTALFSKAYLGTLDFTSNGRIPLSGETDAWTSGGGQNEINFITVASGTEDGHLYQCLELYLTVPLIAGEYVFTCVEA